MYNIYQKRYIHVKEILKKKKKKEKRKKGNKFKFFNGVCGCLGDGY